jgi:hypothetical protein
MEVRKEAVYYSSSNPSGRLNKYKILKRTFQRLDSVPVFRRTTELGQIGRPSLYLRTAATPTGPTE